MVFQSVTIERVHNQNLFSVVRFLVEFASPASSTGLHSSSYKMQTCMDSAERYGDQSSQLFSLQQWPQTLIYGQNFSFLLFWTKYISVFFVYRTVYLLSFHNVNRINIIYQNNPWVCCIHPNGFVVAPDLVLGLHFLTQTPQLSAGQWGAKQGAHPL